MSKYFFLTVLAITTLNINLALAENHAKTERIKIGISAPLTGNAATYGIDIKNALEYANKVIADNWKVVL